MKNIKTTATVRKQKFLAYDYEDSIIKVKPYDASVIEIKSWCPTTENSLCLYNGKIGYVRKIRWFEGDRTFKAGYRFLSSVEDSWCSEGLIYGVKVLEGKTFFLNGKEYKSSDEYNVSDKYYIELTRSERVENMHLINDAYQEGYKAFDEMRGYYSNLKDPNRVRPNIVNPYSNMDILNYFRSEIISSWDAGYKRADDAYMCNLFTKY